MSELQLAAQPLTAFRRGELMCWRSLEPEDTVCWGTGDARGCVTFKVMRIPPELGARMYFATRIGAHWWMAVDVGRHTPRPVADYDTEFGPSQDSCPYLDGMPCYYDGSGLQATEMLQRVAAADTEDAIWAELAGYFDAWIVRS
jgi:hypothetical protein